MKCISIWRPWAAAAAAAGLLVTGSAIPAQAGALQRFEIVIDSVTCTARTTDGDFVIAFGDDFGDGGRSGAFVEGDEGVIMAGGGGQFSIDAAVLMSVDLVAFPGEVPAGTLTVSADVQGLGEPHVEYFEERLGNTWVNYTSTTEAYAFGPAAIAVTGLALDASSMSCDGSRSTFSVVGNDPAATVWSYGDFRSEVCPLQGSPGGVLLLRGEVSAPYLEVVLEDLADPAKAVGELQRRGPVWAAALPLVSMTTGEQVAMLDVTVDLTRIGHDVARFSDGGVTKQLWVTPYRADVTVTGPEVAVTASCITLHERFQTRLAPGTEDHH